MEAIFYFKTLCQYEMIEEVKASALVISRNEGSVTCANLPPVLHPDPSFFGITSGLYILT